MLTRSAKNLLILFIVLGFFYGAGSQYLSAKLRDRVANSVNSQAQAVGQWNDAANGLNTQMTSWQTAINACDKGQSLTCAESADTQGAGYLAAFASQVNDIAMPSSAASAAAAKTVADATRASNDFTTISQDKTVAEYQADMASSGLSSDLSDVQADISSVANALDSSAQ